MLRDFSLRDFGASLNTVESYTNESSQGKIGLCETANKQKCTHLDIFLASETLKSSRGFWRKEIKRLNGARVNTTYCDNTTSAFIIPKMKIDDLYGCLCKIYNMLD